MRKSILAFFSAFVIAITLAGCSSTPTTEQKPVAVEDRNFGFKPEAPKQKPTEVATAPIVPAKPDAGTALSGPAMLRDPNNILSKRLIYFDFDSNIVKEEFRPLVAAHAKYVSQDAKAKMIIQGHTDERGSREYNLALGQRRADAVKQMMSVLGADGVRVETVSFGEEKPAMEGTSESAFSQNRRAVIVYQGE